MMLYAKQVKSEEDFKIIQNCFQKLLNNSKEKGIRLPQSFSQFFQTHDFLARFRTGDLGFQTFEGLTPFPEDENYYITPFFGDSLRLLLVVLIFE